MLCSINNSDWLEIAMLVTAINRSALYRHSVTTFQYVSDLSSDVKVKQRESLEISDPWMITCDQSYKGLYDRKIFIKLATA